MKKLLLISAITLMYFNINAQDYTSAVGLRGGFARGLTYKHFISERVGLEGILMSRYRGINLTGLIEFHNEAFKTDGLKWYWGLGGHLGYYNNDYYSYYSTNGYTAIIGVDAILGIEYSLKDYPFYISLDWKPTYNLFGGYHFNGDSGAISIRYLFER